MTDLSLVPSEAGAPDTRSVYFIQATDGGLIKIGVAAKVRARWAEIQNMSPVHLEVLGYIADGGRQLENDLHQRFAPARCHGEWFEPIQPLLDYIAEHARPMPAKTVRPKCREFTLAEVCEMTQFRYRPLLRDLKANKFEHIRRGSDFYMTSPQIDALIRAHILPEGVVA